MPAVQTQDLLFLLSLSQHSMVGTNLFHRQKRRDVQIVLDLERFVLDFHCVHGTGIVASTILGLLLDPKLSIMLQPSCVNYDNFAQV